MNETTAQAIDIGYTCPHCNQFVKRYKRSFNANMAMALIALHKYSNGEFVHLFDFCIKHCGGKINGDAPKLQVYGFIEKMAGNREDGSTRNGMYRITEWGRLFVMGGVTAYSHFFIFNNNFEGFTGDRITIVDALGKRFNYQELMGFK